MESKNWSASYARDDSYTAVLLGMWEAACGFVGYPGDVRNDLVATVERALWETGRETGNGWHRGTQASYYPRLGRAIEKVLAHFVPAAAVETDGESVTVRFGAAELLFGESSMEVSYEGLEEHCAQLEALSRDPWTFLPITWAARGLPFPVAAEIWSAGAGTAGAYFPDHFGARASNWPAGVEVDEGDLAALVASARDDACEQHRRELGDRAGQLPLPSPRGPQQRDGMLIWDTSVAVILRRAADGMWDVTLRGEHDERFYALEHARDALLYDLPTET